MKDLSLEILVGSKTVSLAETLQRQANKAGNGECGPMRSVINGFLRFESSSRGNTCRRIECSKN